MEITSLRKTNSMLLSLQGRFDAGAADDFKKKMRTLTAQGVACYVIDLSRVSYIDSGGLGSLVTSLRRVREIQGDIRIASLSDKVRRVFELTRVYRIFDIYDSSEAAVASYQAEAVQGVPLCI
jgi:anti-sigma B factor antagonist